ncbi:WSC domain-containing protein [Delphinella strobiligena]|nr:WSC domain-containing protein [Delphinella strobiligena]
MFTTIITPLLAIASLASAGRAGLFKRDLTPETANSTAVVGAGIHGYTYAGCYNETLGLGSSGVRALVGNMTSDSYTTTTTCLDYCHTAGAQYAGLEYGQECWCAPYLDALSVRLDNSSCDLACVGNASEICGGRLTLTLYNVTAKSGASALGCWGVGFMLLGRWLWVWFKMSVVVDMG